MTSDWQMCGEPSCNAIPLNQLGAPVAVDVRRWWCERHRDQAAEGDMQPRGSGVRITDVGTLVPDEPDADEADRAREESRRRKLEEQVAARAVEAAEAAEHRRLREDAHRRELPPGVPG